MSNDKKIYLGRIYRIEDGSSKAHPGMPFRGSKKKQTYDVYKFSTKRKKSYRLEENIDPNSNEPSYVRKRPERVGSSYIHNEYEGFIVKNKNDKTLLKIVKRNPIKIWHKKKK